ncbi:hypothetical protein JCGZ_12177 [Jatropha curcas]|uniref:Uncharacterized protein n=1 Tax=Jatropha curcas TaxID=180498 RepID=A0A067KKT1_JATCU|nr:hypothetical protein JCGZ_12177 [Jatropha curcas]
MEMRTEPFFKSKNGSVFPKKRKLVKRMILDLFIQYFASFCFSCFSGGANEAQLPQQNFSAKNS